VCAAHVADGGFVATSFKCDGNDVALVGNSLYFILADSIQRRAPPMTSPVCVCVCVCVCTLQKLL